MSKNLIFASLILFLSFVLFTFLVHLDLFTAFDFNTTVKLQDKIPDSLTFPFSLLSLIASAEIASVFFLILLFVLRRIDKIYALFLYGFMTFIELLGKFFVDHKGPPFMFFRYDIGFYFPSVHVQPGFSYPSGHMARTAFISALVFAYILGSRNLSRGVKILIFAAILLFGVVMSVSRVYLGEHWTTDVLGGLLIGGAFGLLTNVPVRFTPKISKVLKSL
jgi:undecaprenyl-diphosphatase